MYRNLQLGPETLIAMGAKTVLNLFIIAKLFQFSSLPMPHVHKLEVCINCKFHVAKNFGGVGCAIKKAKSVMNIGTDYTTKVLAEFCKI